MYSILFAEERTTLESQIDTKEDLKLSQWIYTAGDNSEYLYIIGGPNPTSLFVAKADAVSLEGIRTWNLTMIFATESLYSVFSFSVLQKISLPPGLYIGGLLMHRNGHVSKNRTVYM